MIIRWTAKAHRDLLRLHDFLPPVNPPAAARTVQTLVTAVGDLRRQPQIGLPLEEFGPRNVRRVIVGDYELRYEIVGDDIFVLRLWHVREDR